ncbi:MAG: methyl-accepting chemotaxis protein, partial [Steroidobacteraceae bacterium]
MPDRRPASKWMPVMLWGGLLLSLAAAALLLLSGRAHEQDRAYRAHLAELTVLAGALPTQAAAAGRGDDAAFEKLTQSRARLEKLLADIAEGRAIFAALSSPSARRLGDEPGWNAVLGDSRQVLAGRDAARELKTWAAQSRTALGRVLAATGNAVSAPGGAVALRALPRFESVAQRTGDDLQQLTEAAGDSAASVRRITENTALLAQFLAGLAGLDRTAGVPAVSGEAATRLADAREAFAGYEKKLQGALERAGTLATAQRASGELAEASDKLSRSLERQAATDVDAGTWAGPWPALIAVLLVALTLAGALVAWVSASGVRRVANQEAERNRRNQDAILRLLDEMSSLADGDLTVHATVTDDITGAIADSINYAIEALRELVATINETAMQLDSAARQTLAAAGHLAKASVAQSRQVAAATDAVSAMAASIEEVSGNAERSADVARHAVDVAHKGGDAVRRTIDGMNTIRENIQDTSKRIKRLGESSQEIGNIVELINDIAEQTNILALNASIQASMAGESGRGF